MRKSEAVQLYERAMRGRGYSPETVAVNLRTVRRFLVDLDVPLGRLRRQQVLAALAAMQRAGLAGATQARALGVLRAFWMHRSDTVPSHRSESGPPRLTDAGQRRRPSPSLLT